MVDQFTNILAEDGEATPPEEPEEPELPTTVAEAIENGTKYADTTPIKDDLDNTVYIPGGFHLAGDSATKVEGGIVIEDESGNQFVWIPTGEYKVSTTLSSTGTLTNKLSRRQWGTIAGTVQEPTLLLEDEAANGRDGTNYYGEGDSRSVSSGQVEAFLSSAKPVSEGGHGGFYIGRYEQGEGNVCKAGVTPYVNVTRNTAKTQVETMYSGKTEIKATSELISSYAWDTALNYICQTNSVGYTLATTTDSNYGNIGTGTDISNRKNTGAYSADKYSNIHDFLGNCCEWTTEYYSISDNPCVYRGGHSYRNIGYAAYRSYNDTNYSNDYISFRTQIYV